MITIRMAQHDETLAIATLMKGFEQETSHVKVNVEYTAQRYTDLVKQGIAHLFILEDDGKMIGGLGCIINRDLHDGIPVAVESYWYVHPDHRGGGQMLLDRFESFAKEQGCKRALMVHLEDSHPESLKRLYGRRGYKLVEQTYMKEI